jgi:outer membrane protein OmpA-like peptidoglycan-associated protein
MTGYAILRAPGALILISAVLGSMQAAEVKDHPLVSRFAGSAVVESSIAEFDEYPLILGPYKSQKFSKIQRIEGKITHFHYTLPENRSPLEVLRSYQNALAQGGFQVLFTCMASECGDAVNTDELRRWIGMWCNNCGDPPMRYLAAKLSRPSGDVYVAVKVNRGSCWGCGPQDGSYVNVIEVKPMAAASVTVNTAAKMAGDIAQAGHAAIYGIYFDTGKATLKPESEPAFVEIVKLLSSNAQLKLIVAGHTDNAGAIAANMALSKQRADAVVAALTGRFRVAPDRLQAVGVGPSAPVDTNHTEAGRARNRRVELVEQ